jgi:hypothetical protein
MNDRPAHAPCFVRSHDEPEPRFVGGFFIDDTKPRRTFDVPDLVTPHRSTDAKRISCRLPALSGPGTA